MTGAPAKATIGEIRSNQRGFARLAFLAAPLGAVLAHAVDDLNTLKPIVLRSSIETILAKNEFLTGFGFPERIDTRGTSILYRRFSATVGGSSRVEDSAKPTHPTGGGAATQAPKKQFYGSIELDAIQAESATGFDDGLQRAVKENPKQQRALQLLRQITVSSERETQHPSKSLVWQGKFDLHAEELQIKLAACFVTIYFAIGPIFSD